MTRRRAPVAVLALAIVAIAPLAVACQSAPDEAHFVWKYHVRIENKGDLTVQLRNRYWRITDSLGRVQEVRGAGVMANAKR